MGFLSPPSTTVEWEGKAGRLGECNVTLIAIKGLCTTKELICPHDCVANSYCDADRRPKSIDWKAEEYFVFD